MKNVKLRGNTMRNLRKFKLNMNNCLNRTERLSWRIKYMRKNWKKQKMTLRNKNKD